MFNFNLLCQSCLLDEGKGILNGCVFLDCNCDGICQNNELGILGVCVMVIGMCLVLNILCEGYFIIQNVKQGLYLVMVSKKSLLFGYMVLENVQLCVIIGVGCCIDVEILLILLGQVWGMIFVDVNVNGFVDFGEKCVEGQWVRLIFEGSGEILIIYLVLFG